MNVEKEIKELKERLDQYRVQDNVSWTSLREEFSELKEQIEFQDGKYNTLFSKYLNSEEVLRGLLERMEYVALDDTDPIVARQASHVYSKLLNKLGGEKEVTGCPKIPAPCGVTVYATDSKLPSYKYGLIKEVYNPSKPPSIFDGKHVEIQKNGYLKLIDDENPSEPPSCEECEFVDNRQVIIGNHCYGCPKLKELIDIKPAFPNLENPSDSKPFNCSKCDWYGECDHQGAYKKDGKWCYEDQSEQEIDYKQCNNCDWNLSNGCSQQLRRPKKGFNCPTYKPKEKEPTDQDIPYWQCPKCGTLGMVKFREGCMVERANLQEWHDYLKENGDPYWKEMEKYLKENK